jgi:hypothetical protein
MDALTSLDKIADKLNALTLLDKMKIEPTTGSLTLDRTYTHSNYHIADSAVGDC